MLACFGFSSSVINLMVQCELRLKLKKNLKALLRSSLITISLVSLFPLMLLPITNISVTFVVLSFNLCLDKSAHQSQGLLISYHLKQDSNKLNRSKLPNFLNIHTVHNAK
jgi:hypothetical protein